MKKSGGVLEEIAQRSKQNEELNKEYRTNYKLKERHYEKVSC